jgi:hypothetical protein
MILARIIPSSYEQVYSGRHFSPTHGSTGP